MIEIRRAKLSDAGDIRVLNHANLPEKYSIEFIRYILAAEGAHYIVEAEGMPIGYILAPIERAASIVYRKLPGPIGHIVSVAVDAKYRRRGIGRELIKRVIEDLKGKVIGITLEVRVSNEPAISLYSSLGFSTLEIWPNYYRDGENALVMIYRY